MARRPNTEEPFTNDNNEEYDTADYGIVVVTPEDVARLTAEALDALKQAGL